MFFFVTFFFRECNRMLQKRNWEKDSHKVHFESGVRMGIGAFNLVSDVAAVFEKREVLDLVLVFFPCMSFHHPCILNTFIWCSSNYSHSNASTGQHHCIAIIVLSHMDLVIGPGIQLGWSSGLCSADAGSVPWHSKGVQTLVVFVQPLCVIMSINVCVHIIKLHALAVIPLLGHTKLQHALGKPLRTECGRSSGKWLENGHVCNFSLKIGVLPV